MESKYNIFIVDDDPFNLLLISRQLKKTLNCSTRLYKSALACIHDTGNEKPDLILTDYMLTDKPGHKLNGDYVLERLKNKYANVPVIMYSSIMNADLTLSLLQKGAADFILRDDVFLEKITRRVNFQLTRMKQKMSRRMAQIAVVISVVVLGLALVSLDGEHKALMIPFSVIWIILLALIFFYKNPEDTDFYGDFRR